MKALIINGSPKGARSITLQTLKYLELKFPEDSFTFINIALNDKALNKSLPDIVKLINETNIVVFSYPVYTFMAPAQLHKFIAALKNSSNSFEGKFTTQITTSKHFYDVTAHTYVEENCVDLGFSVLPGLSADMEDLTKEAGRKQAYDFWAHIHWLIAGKPAPENINNKYEISLVTDANPTDKALNEMIDSFVKTFPGKTRVLNLNDFPFQGGCLGCLKCAATGKCVYTDGFDNYLRDEVQSTNAIIYAFTIKDHSMGPLFKTYDDRQFCNGHRTVMMGHPVGYLISGKYSSENNLQTIIKARAQVGGNYLAGVASDEDDTLLSIKNLSGELIFALEHEYLPPKNFYGVGGMRIFRDLIYQMQGLMKLDHKFFKSHGQYDFPHNSRGKIWAMYLVGILFSNPKLMKKMGSKINEGMMMPYKKVLDAEKNK